MPDPSTTQGWAYGPYLVEVTHSHNATTPRVVFRDVFGSPDAALSAFADSTDALTGTLVAMPHSVSLTSRRVRWEHLAGDLEEDWSDYSEHALLRAWRERFAIGTKEPCHAN